ncbi:Trp biosynthesis-associated membrane protein [Cryobacterium tepidiphilum]|uniref:Peptidase n=1 Tax=Cryobacterium tepidiphilum TaxID=2486026 RepID=A0A3M8LP92_9MICO|nr:Trp biosynthesis-associated membrane protein [Cryobacterium tepidiphilum]RNE66534.1 hypothetical protein EEJ31_03810 [Cryobacterium tepidiphilum]
MTGRRVKLLLILAVLAGSGLALLAWTQTWVEVDVTEAAAASHLSVTGSTAAPAVTALALAGLALAGALTIAGPVIRGVLGVLAVLLGVSVFIAALAPITDPAAASAPAVTAVTGVAGQDAVRTDIAGAAITFWPWIAVAGAVLLAAAGVGVLLTARRWPGPTRRYQTRFAPAEGTAPAAGTARSEPTDAAADAPDAVGDWDQLSRGDDPTA